MNIRKMPHTDESVHLSVLIYLYAVVVSSLQALYDSSHCILVSFGDIEADVFHQRILFKYVHKIGSYVSIGLLWRGKSHFHPGHFLRDNGYNHVLGRVFGFWEQNNNHLSLTLLFLFRE